MKEKTKKEKTKKEKKEKKKTTKVEAERKGRAHVLPCTLSVKGKSVPKSTRLAPKASISSKVYSRTS